MPQWGTRDNDIIPPGWIGPGLIGTSMFSKVALMLPSCVNMLLFEGEKNFCDRYMPHFCPPAHRYHI